MIQVLRRRNRKELDPVVHWSWKKKNKLQNNPNKGAIANYNYLLMLAY
jgi:hypothetical protein